MQEIRTFRCWARASLILTCFLGPAYLSLASGPSSTASWHPVLTLINQTSAPVIDQGTMARLAGDGTTFGFEGGRVVKDDHGRLWLFTAEFQGLPVNANMRLAIWCADKATGPWERHSTIAGQASKGDATSLDTWNKTCSKDNFEASPWAPFPVFSEEEDRWHVLWISYACDLSWVVRVGIGNLFGAVSQTPGRDGIGGPYVSYGIIIGPNASAPNALKWGDLDSCAACHSGKQPIPAYCSSHPCKDDNSKTGAAIGIGPWAMPPGSPTKFAAFVGLDHSYAGADSPRGPWTVYTSQQMGQYMFVKMSTSSSLYCENPVVSEVVHPDGSNGFITVFDSVSPTGGWAKDGGRWTQAGRGEWYGFGISYSQNGQFWTDGEDVALKGGVRTPLGLVREADGTYTLMFTRRFADCKNQILPYGSRGDAANDPGMCALLYAASFNLSWIADTNEIGERHSYAVEALSADDLSLTSAAHWIEYIPLVAVGVLLGWLCFADNKLRKYRRGNPLMVGALRLSSTK